MATGIGSHPDFPSLPKRAAPTQAPQTNSLRRAGIACFIGNFVEWFDYASYGFMAALIARLFFPEYDNSAALIATFLVFALSFLVRPLGGVFWGHIGDRIGRKSALSLSIIIMSIATFCIALLPTYQAIGIAAPCLLLTCRLVQGFSASGEYAGAATFLTEHAPCNQKGYYASLVPASAAAGLLFGSLFVSGLYAWLDTEQLHTWGWRIPFALAAPFGMIGLYIRLHLEDAQEFVQFQQAQKQAAAQPAPIRKVLSQYPLNLMAAFGVTSLNAVGFYLLLSYMPTYLMVELSIPETRAFAISTATLTCYIVAVFAVGKLSDRVGRRRLLIYASVCFIMFTLPLFHLMEQGSVLLVLLVQILLGLFLALNDGTLSCYLCELFPTNVRYSGFAFSFNSANALFGGTAPLVATTLIQVTGSTMAPGYYLIIVAFLALTAILYSHKSRLKPSDNV